MTSLVALPAIKVGGQVTQQVIRQVPSPPSKMGSLGSPGMRTRTGPSSRGQMEMKRQSFEKIETARYRNTYEHNLCLDMLHEGFHQSFCELFNLMSQQRQERDQLGPDSGLVDQVLLQDDPDKLDQLKLYLTTAEAAKRRGKMDHVYHSLLALAQYFEQAGDAWLSDHFYNSCLKTSLKIRGDGRRKESEANCNVGLALEKKGDLYKAAAYFESFYNLTKGRLWQTDGGDNLHSMSCENLKRVYTAISDLFKEESMMDAISYLLKAYEMAKESGDNKQEGLAGYRLGNAYEEVNDAETAILYHNGYLDKCQQLHDDVGMGRACQALARAYEMQGDIESAMKYLEMFVELADRAKQLPEQQRACFSLGTMYNSQGKYMDSVRMFSRAYEIAQDLKNPEITEQARIHLGVASAHVVLSGYASCMNNIDKPNIQRMLDFKSAREDSFSETDKLLPQEGPSSRQEIVLDNGSQGSAEESGVSADAQEPTGDAEEPKAEEQGGEGEAEATDSGVTSEGDDAAKENSS